MKNNSRKKKLRIYFERKFRKQRVAQRRAFINRAIARLIGFLIIIISIAIVPIIEYDATHCLIMVPLGVMIFLNPQYYELDIFEFLEDLKEDFSKK